MLDPGSPHPIEPHAAPQAALTCLQRVARVVIDVSREMAQITAPRALQAISRHGLVAVVFGARQGDQRLELLPALGQLLLGPCAHFCLAGNLNAEVERLIPQ